MMQLAKAALGAAVALSVVSIADAAVRATTTGIPPWDPDEGTTWGYAALSALLAVTFLLLAAVLVRAAEPIDAGSASRRWLRRVLAADLVVLAVGGVVSTVVDAAFLGGVAGIAFLVMFLLGTALGATLLRRVDVRAPAVLMAASVPVLALTFLLEMVAPGWGHPAYGETALYLGVALLGMRIATGTAAEARPEAVSARS